MANFDNTGAKILAVGQASNLLGTLQSVYQQAKQLQILLLKYNANTDPVFTAAVNAVYTSAERTELGAMLTTVNALLTDWETNHKLPLNLP